MKDEMPRKLYRTIMSKKEQLIKIATLLNEMASTADEKDICWNEYQDIDYAIGKIWEAVDVLNNIE